MKLRFTLLSLLASVQTSCFVDPSLDSEKRFESKGDEISTQRGTSSVTTGQGLCQFSLGRGCFDGYIGFKKDFFVSGVSYFNADAFASQFAQLLKVKDRQGGVLAEGKDFKVEVLTPIDQNSFTSSFEYELIGVMTRSGKVAGNGAFSVNDLMDGSGYELRVQRPIQFKIARLSQDKPSDPSETSVNKPLSENSDNIDFSEEKIYCATLYQDSLIEIRKGLRTYERFNDFKIHFSEKECNARKSETVLSF